MPLKNLQNGHYLLLSTYVIIAIFTVPGNGIIIIVFCKESKLRRKTNYYIASLAVADLLIGLVGVPLTVATSMRFLDSNINVCLLTISVIFSTCGVSILNLLAISGDRYWAILSPINYSQNVRKKETIRAIAICWIVGFLIGFLPLFGWHANGLENKACALMNVINSDHKIFISVGLVLVPSLIMAVFYSHIYYILTKRRRRIITIDPRNGYRSTDNLRSEGSQDNVMLRVMGAKRKQHVKTAKSFFVILVFFLVCWSPICVMIIVATVRPDDVVLCDESSVWCYTQGVSIILAHLNSAANPILYACHLKGFKEAFINLLP